MMNKENRQLIARSTVRIQEDFYVGDRSYLLSSRKFWLETMASAKMRKRPSLDAGAVAEG
jgi:hypothetical protein